MSTFGGARALKLVRAAARESFKRLLPLRGDLRDSFQRRLSTAVRVLGCHYVCAGSWRCDVRHSVIEILATTSLQPRIRCRRRVVNDTGSTTVNGPFGQGSWTG